tara:strand:+ start:339 stop:737 length:399 start_codon:yes stop_codon:yes gene_type:complete
MIVGASNPAGVSITSLNYVKNRAYAYSGEIQLGSTGTNTPETMLKFSTGSENIKGKLAIQNGSGAGDDMKYEVFFNGETISMIYSGSSDVGNQIQFPLHLVIPPYTNVLIEGRNVSSSNPRTHTATFTGRLF